MAAPFLLKRSFDSRRANEREVGLAGLELPIELK
jgi:hypothetical protein